jgi:hypothetical protein
MIIYDLSCDNEHRFEGWFQSAADFESQQASHLITCPQCDSHQIRRIPSVVALGKTHVQPPKRASQTSQLASGPGTAMIPPGTQIMAMYRQLVQTIMDSSEDVGPSFADEARKIHYDQAPERPIRGQATPDECEALRDEGIEVLNLPVIPEENLN